MTHKISQPLTNDDLQDVGPHQRKIMLALGLIPGRQTTLTVKKLGMTEVMIAESGSNQWFFMRN